MRSEGGSIRLGRTALLLAFSNLGLAGSLSMWAQPATPLILPAGIAYSSSGDLYFAETGNHVVRRLSVANVLTIIAGSGIQGFAGDAGPAAAAQLDSPGAIAFDPAGDLFIADNHNHRIRKVDAVTGVMSTVQTTPSPSALAFNSANNSLAFADSVTHQVSQISGTSSILLAGSGQQGFAGDGGSAIAASLNSPSGIAFDASGNLYIADTSNHRLRRVDHATGVISTIAGSGIAGYSAVLQAQQTSLDHPRGIAFDALGNLIFADSGNQRLRSINLNAGTSQTIAGDGTQAFLGDGLLAVAASLDTPRAVSLSSAGLPTIADTSNNRIRQVDSNQVDSNAAVVTIAGLGAAIAGPAKSHTTTTLTATLAASVSSASGLPSGIITLNEAGATIASAALTAGSASFVGVVLSPGIHTLTCAYLGDANDLPSVSAPILISIAAPAPADFLLTSVGSSAAASLPASFNFLVTPTGAPLSSTIQLSASGLPNGSTASFIPAYLVPQTAAAPFTVTLSPALAKARPLGVSNVEWLAFVLPLAVVYRRRRRICLLGLLLLTGCGDRVNEQLVTGSTVQTYTVLLSATATSSNGAVLLHTATITLSLQ